MSGDEKRDEVPGEAIDAPLSGDRLLSAIIENIPNMVFVKDAEALAFTHFNRAGEELLGTKRETLLGKTDLDLFSPEDAAHFQAKDRETLANKVLVDIPEEPLETASGRRWLHTKKVPIVDADGRPRYLLGISEDITERKAAEAALREAKAKAESANAELEAFAYAVAHDLRTPLRAIDGFSQALLDDYAETLDANGQRHLDNVRRAAQKMARLIDALLVLAKLTRREPRFVSVDLSELAQKEIERLRASDPGRSVDVSIAHDLVVDGDPKLVGTALEQLLDNAWKFTRTTARARIEVGSAETARGVAIFVRDNGVGFDPQYADKLFTAFQRLHDTDAFEGMGVGLAMVARAIRRHGGSVWAESSPSAGATFWFTLRG